MREDLASHTGRQAMGDGTVPLVNCSVGRRFPLLDDSPDFWDRVMFPHGFHVPKLTPLPKLQAWRLKPASK